MHNAMNITPRKRNKYRAVKVSIDGRVFHSKREGAHYVELRLREKAGEIMDLKCQVPIQLFAHCLADGSAVPTIKYIVDFTYYDKILARQIFVDVKGCVTAEFVIKKKTFEACYSQTLTLVR